MTGTWEGLSVPLYGAYIRGSSAQVTQVSVDSKGCIDYTITNSTTTADNALVVNYTVSGATTGGYNQGIYINYKISSTTTSGNNANQMNALAIDLDVGGVTHASWIGGQYIYIYSSTAPTTITDATVYGIKIDMNEITDADYNANLILTRNGSTAASACDAFIAMWTDDADCATKSLFHYQGPTKPTYFLQMSDATESGFFSNRVVTAAASTGALKCYIGTTTYYIPLLASST